MWIGGVPVVVATVWLAQASLTGQAAQSTAATPQTRWTAASKTPDGQPDLRGTWSNFDSTPMEPESAIKGASYAGAFDTVDSPISPTRRSMVVEPANGLVRIKPFAEEERDYHRARITDH